MGVLSGQAFDGVKPCGHSFGISVGFVSSNFEQRSWNIAGRLNDHCVTLLADRISVQRKDEDNSSNACARVRASCVNGLNPSFFEMRAFSGNPNFFRPLKNYVADKDSEDFRSHQIHQALSVEYDQAAVETCFRNACSFGSL